MKKLDMSNYKPTRVKTLDLKVLDSDYWKNLSKEELEMIQEYIESLKKKK